MNQNICRNCGYKILKPKLIFKNHPISLWPTIKKLKNNKSTLKVYECKSCLLIQLQRFRNKDVIKFYESEQFIIEDKNILMNRVNLIKKKIPLINFKNKKILEIGGGRNNILSYLPSSEKWINDVSIINKKLNGIKVIKSSYENFKIKKNYFDYIFFFHTLEHIENPKKFLKKIFELLKKNGKIILEVPNISYYTKKNPYHAFYFQHLLLFDYNSLNNLITSCGFEIYKKHSINKKIILLSYKKNQSAIISKKYKKKKTYLSNIINKFNKNLKKNKKILINLNKAGNKIGFYGVGGTSITMLIHLKKLINKIDFFYDSDSRKINKYIPLTNFKVRSYNKLFADRPNTLIFNSKSTMEFIKKKYKCKKYILLE